jgi:hypothetical protein
LTKFADCVFCHTPVDSIPSTRGKNPVSRLDQFVDPSDQIARIHSHLPLFILEKAVSRKARQERKGKSGSYQAKGYHPKGADLYSFKCLNFFATFAPLRE